MGERNALSSIDADYHHTVIANAIPIGGFTKWCLPADNGGMRNEEDELERALVETRRANLDAWVRRDFKSQSEFGDWVKRQQGQISAMITGAIDAKTQQPKSFGYKVARRLERDGGLLRGQLDIPNSPLEYDKNSPRRRDDIDVAYRAATATVSDYEKRAVVDLLARLRVHPRKTG